jgi:hypothetical protein
VTALYAGTSSGLYVVGGSEGRDFEDRSVGALHVDAGGGLYALVEATEVWNNPGSGWKRLAVSDNLRLNCVSATGGDIWVGAAEAHLLREDGGELVPDAGFEGAPGRDQWFTPWGGPPDVRSLATSDGDLFVNVHVGGILRNDLHNRSWEPTIEIGSDVHEVVASGASSEGVWAATARGLAQSSDRGETWEFDDDGLHASYARAVALGREHVFMTASQGPFGGRAALYRKPYGGRGFEKIDRGLPEWFDGNIDTGCVTASGSSVAFGTENGDVCLSDDGGDSWEQIAANLGAVKWLEFVDE